MDQESKLDALEDKLIKLVNRFGEVVKMYEANLNANFDYLEQPMHFPEQKQTPGLDNEQVMYDAQESIEDEEENDQEMPDCLPMSCTMLTREYHDLMAKANRKCCFQETSDHTEDAEFEAKEEPALIEVPPSG